VQEVAAEGAEEVGTVTDEATGEALFYIDAVGAGVEEGSSTTSATDNEVEAGEEDMVLGAVDKLLSSDLSRDLSRDPAHIHVKDEDTVSVSVVEGVTSSVTKKKSKKSKKSQKSRKAEAVEEVREDLPPPTTPKAADSKKKKSGKKGRKSSGVAEEEEVADRINMQTPDRPKTPAEIEAEEIALRRSTRKRTKLDR
jgi:hypothetical protein